MEKTLPQRTLVIGGAASGKSAWAEAFVSASGLRPVYVATGQAFDEEMRQKISRHKDRRGPEWRTIEEPFDIGSALANCASGEVVLIDCATLWLTNHLLAENNLKDETSQFAKLITDTHLHLIVVTNEVGDGIVPMDAMSRHFREAQGQLNQRLASEADLVVRVTAGLPMALKGTLPSWM